MSSLFYFVLAAMLTTYAVLDGFDFGAGMMHLLVAKTDDERRTVLASIGAVWDGNEVWLVGSAGVLFFAFPQVYAAALSGLYLPFMFVLWLLILRGMSIVLRSQLDHPLWRTAWDGVFAFASTVMAFVLGVALANVVRGVPLDATGYFHEDLFTNFSPVTSPGARLGAIDAYTALVGLFAVAALAAHGATWVAWKTDGEVEARANRLVPKLFTAVLALGALVTVATALTQPEHFGAFLRRPWLWPLPAVAVLAAASGLRAGGATNEARAFAASAVVVGSLLVATAGTLFPVVLRSTVDPKFDLEASAVAAAPSTLTLGAAILLPALALGVSYFVNLYRSFRGKVTASDAHD